MMVVVVMMKLMVSPALPHPACPLQMDYAPKTQRGRWLEQP